MECCLNDIWTIKQNARYARVNDHYTSPLHGYRFVTNPISGLNDQRYQTRYGVDWQQDNKVFGVDNITQAEFDTGPFSDVDGKAFEPSTGKPYEVGVKYQPPGQNSFVQVSAYELEQENVLTSNLAAPGFSNQSGAVCSKGIEFEAKAELTDALNVIASASRNDIKYTKDNDGRKGRHPAANPPLTAALWLNYTVLGDTPFAGLGAGIGTRYARGSYGDD